MEEIKFTKDDVGKWAFELSSWKWAKIIDFTDDECYPVKVELTKEVTGLTYTADGRFLVESESPKLIPADHPYIKGNKIELPIPPKPKKKIVLPAGKYYLIKGGQLILPKRITINDTLVQEEFELENPITLVDGVD